MAPRENIKIFDLLDQLCKVMVKPENHISVLKHVTQFFSNCPNSIGHSTPYNELALISNISNHLNRYNSIHVPLYMNLHEKLKSSYVDHRNRQGVIMFLFFLSELENNVSDKDVWPSLSMKYPTIQNERQEKINSIFEVLRTDKGKLINKENVIEASGFLKEKPSMCMSPVDINMEIANQRSTKICSDSTSTDSSPRDAYGRTKKVHEISPYDLNNDLVQNVVYSFTGISGNYLKKDVITGKFKLNTKVRTLNFVQAGMLQKLSELGYYHDQLKSFTDTKTGRTAIGLMGQGFISALRNEVTKYYGMVALVQEQINRECNDKGNNNNGDKFTLLKLMVWAVDPLERLKWLTKIAEACQEKKGGALASIVYNFLNNGNPMVKSLAQELLIALCGPLQQMLSRWLLEGEIMDPFSEFFIECLSEVNPDRLWHSKYRVRNTMLPIFISTDMANKILVTGKSINFLREICQDKSPIIGREELKTCLKTNDNSIFSYVADTKLHTTIDTAYLNTSKKVLDIVMGPHKLMYHLQAMRRYLLLGQGDFIGILMENLKSKLDKPGKELFTYDISSVMDSAIRSTNAQHDDPEILNHLDVRLLGPYDGDTGWDILSLEYTVRGPLKTMLETSMHNYQILFKPLWKMKHMEFLLSSKIWTDQIASSKKLRPIGPQLNPIMYRLHLFTSEMIHFIHQMQYYILFEVIECSWVQFQEKIHQAKALDDVLKAHDEFLEKIKIGAFLDEKSESLANGMEDVYLGITRLEIWQDKFFALCFKELDSIKEYRAAISLSEVKGGYGETAEKRLQRDEEQRHFEQNLIVNQKSLEKIGCEYDIAVRQFLLNLNSNNDHNLQLFGIRLDFNEHYKKRDQRLCVPLTFEHMRNSNVFFNNNKSMNNSHYSIN